ncbi:protein of unknown function [Ruminococcaceae bacterium BL-6]|jgi:hypothetical protein|nr:protein of unknown function [Ruminococcaceae bacterium BL-6]
MLESDEKMAGAFFVFGTILALAAMVLGPLEIVSWSVAFGVTSCFVALVGMYFAFQSWDEPDPAEQEPAAEAVNGAENRPHP